MPSLHSAYALLVVRVLPADRAQALVAVAARYPLAMTFTLVYSGEHYMIDVFVGWATSASRTWWSAWPSASGATARAPPQRAPEVAVPPPPTVPDLAGAQPPARSAQLHRGCRDPGGVRECATSRRKPGRSESPRARAMIVAGQPGLAAIRRVQLRVVPVQRERGRRTARLGRADRRSSLARTSLARGPRHYVQVIPVWVRQRRDARGPGKMKSRRATTGEAARRRENGNHPLPRCLPSSATIWPVSACGGAAAAR